MADDPSKFFAHETGTRNMASDDMEFTGYLRQNDVDNELIK